MRQFTLLGLLGSFLLLSAVLVGAQDDGTGATDPAAGGEEGEGGSGDGEKSEECEEAWEYVEFLKTSVK